MYTFPSCGYVRREASAAFLFGDVATPGPKFGNSSLPDVEALVLDPLAAVSVRVLEAEVVVVAELLGEDVICKIC